MNPAAALPSLAVRAPPAAVALLTTALPCGGPAAVAPPDHRAPLLFQGRLSFFLCVLSRTVLLFLVFDRI